MDHMARPFRIEFLETLCHLTARSNARQPISLDVGDQSHFLHPLVKALSDDNAN